MWCYIMVCDVNHISQQNFIQISSTWLQNILKRSTKHSVFKWSTQISQSPWSSFLSCSFSDFWIICVVWKHSRLNSSLQSYTCLFCLPTFWLENTQSIPVLTAQMLFLVLVMKRMPNDVSERIYWSCERVMMR